MFEVVISNHLNLGTQATCMQVRMTIRAITSTPQVYVPDRRVNYPNDMPSLRHQEMNRFEVQVSQAFTCPRVHTRPISDHRVVPTCRLYHSAQSDNGELGLVSSNITLSLSTRNMQGTP